MEASNPDEGRVHTELREVVILPREAVNVVRPRREELEALAKDVLAHSGLREDARTFFSGDDRTAQRGDVRSCFDKLCEAFTLERVRVYVQVMGDDASAMWTRDEENERLGNLYRFLKSWIWVDADDERRELPSVSVLDDPTPDSVCPVRLWPIEMEAFQTFLYAKYASELIVKSRWSDGDVIHRDVIVAEMYDSLVCICSKEKFLLSKSPIFDSWSYPKRASESFYFSC